MKKLFKRRFPTYFSGFLFGLVAVVIILQLKKATAPDFAEMSAERAPVMVSAGGMIRLVLGDEPEKHLAWGFPTQLAVGKKGNDGRYDSIMRLEYKDLVEPEVLLGPLTEAGQYEIVAKFYSCAYPGEKYCARVNLTQPVLVVLEPPAPEKSSDPKLARFRAPKESTVKVDVKSAALTAAEQGKAREAQARPIP